MKKLVLALLIAMISFAAYSQKLFFLYVQAETEQPFFIKLQNKIYSSSAGGYLILSKLGDSTYNFTIGFPQNKWPDQQFSVNMNRKDQGFLLKNFGDKGWGLFNIQTLAVQMSTSPVSKVEAPVKKVEGTVSDFTEILARAADDPSLREKPERVIPQEVIPVAIVPEPAKKNEEVKTKTITEIPPVQTQSQPAVAETKEQIKDTIVVAKTQPVVSDEKKLAERNTVIKPIVAEKDPIVKTEVPAIQKTVDTVSVKAEPAVNKKIDQPSKVETAPATVEKKPIVSEEVYARSSVTKRSETSTSDGFGLVFIDAQANGVTDTIRIVIPNPKPLVEAIKEETKPEKKFIEITPDTVAKMPVKEQIKEQVKVNEVKMKCTEIASESDFLKLRKKMANGDGDEDMLNEAKKYFKLKCFSTAQIKNLSTMFLNDGAKYKFYDNAYGYVTDPNNYASLQGEMTDPYYVNRFKAMLK